MSDRKIIIIMLVGFESVFILTGCTNWEKHYRACEKKYKALEKNYTSQLQYKITDLGKLPKYVYGLEAINDKGQIVGHVGMRYVKVEISRGWAEVPQGHSRAIIFDPTGGGNNTELGTLGGQARKAGHPNSRAYSINDNSQIVGGARTKSGNLHACLFDPTGAGNNIDLGTLGGGFSNANCINDNGQTVGNSQIDGVSRNHACLFDPTGAGNNIDLGTLGGDASNANYINDNGQIVGSAHTKSGNSHACMFDPTGAGNNIDLGTLGGDRSDALCINNAGQIVGRVYPKSGNINAYRACLFDPTGSGNNIDLGTLGGDTSVALSINDNGQIVGQAGIPSTAIDRAFTFTHACLFDPTGSGANIDLNMVLPKGSGWVLKSASSINNHGWIIGEGIKPGGERHAYLLTPRGNR